MTQTYPRHQGDTSGPFIRDLALGLVSAGDDVTVLTPHAAGLDSNWKDGEVEVRTFRYAPEGLEVVGYSRSLSSDEKLKWRAALVSPLYLVAARQALKREALRNQPDLVHAHWAVPNGLVAAAAGLSVPFGIGLHGSDVFLAERAPIATLVSKSLQRASFLTGCSPELVSRVCAIGFDESRSAVIPYGVNVDQFRPDVGRRFLWRQKLGISESATVILAVGRMVTKKGFHVLLPTLRDVLPKFPETHVVLAGGGDRLEEFKARAADISGNIHFPDLVLRDTLPDLYRAADLFVLPAVHDAKGNVDGLPNVILEAMASGLPVIASEISGIPLAIEHERQGLLVPEQQSEALASALMRLIEDVALRHEMGMAARAKAVSELTWPAVAARYRQSYLDALASSARDGARN